MEVQVPGIKGESAPFQACPFVCRDIRGLFCNLLFCQHPDQLQTKKSSCLLLREQLSGLPQGFQLCTRRQQGLVSEVEVETEK